MATIVFESLRQPVSACRLTSTGKQFRFVHKNLDVDKVPAVCTHLPFFCSQASKQPLISFQMWLNNENIFLFSSWEFLGFFFCQNSFSIYSFLEMSLLTKWENKRPKDTSLAKRSPQEPKITSSLQSFTLLPMWSMCLYSFLNTFISPEEVGLLLWQYGKFSTFLQWTVLPSTIKYFWCKMLNSTPKFALTPIEL